MEGSTSPASTHSDLGPLASRVLSYIQYFTFPVWGLGRLLNLIRLRLWYPHRFCLKPRLRLKITAYGVYTPAYRPMPYLRSRGGVAVSRVGVYKLLA